MKQINHTSVRCLIDFLPSCLEAPVVDAEVGCQIQGHDVAGARVGAAWLSVPANRLKKWL